MSKKNCSIDSNNKIFDRNFNYDTSFASFNENILKDRAFGSFDNFSSNPLSNHGPANETVDRLGNRFIDTVKQWNEVNKVSFADNNESSILDDRKIGTNINTSVNPINTDRNFSDRIFNINPNMTQASAEDYFRDISKKNFDTRKTGDKIPITGQLQAKKDTITNPNKKFAYFVEPNNSLSMKMLTFYQYIFKGSFICSSYSLLAVLSLFYIGTTKETKAELERCLGINGRNNFYNGLVQVNEALKKSGFVKVGNCIIVNNKTKLSKNYKTLVQKVGLLESVDMSNPGSVIMKVNKWVSDNTRGLIKNILRDGSLNKTTELVLVNTIYFKSNWKTKFSKENTQEKEFYDLVETKTVKMMQLFKESLPYYENKKYQLLELPYKGNQFAMGVMLEKDLNQIMIPPKPETLYSHIARLGLEKVNVQLPRFTHESTLYPTDILKMIGLQKMFIQADVDDMVEKVATNKNNIHINSIIQKAKIIVDETGTEASAATAMMLSYNSALPDKKENVYNFYANHPFIYYIRHTPTNTIIFTGCFN